MKKLFYLGLILITAFQMKAQVSDISLNLTPTANYIWWDSQMFIKDGPMVGGIIGIGLGRNLELRGIYEQSVNLKSTLNSLNMPVDFVNKFSDRDVDVSRWGGEFKANIPTRSVLEPYLTLGTGVQKLKYYKVKQEQIYLSGGLGAKFNLSDRITLNIEGKLHAFNLDPSSILRINDPEADGFNDWIDENITNDRMMNWSLNVGFQFYLGGKNTSNYSDLDRALEKQYKRGLSGLRFVFEPGGAYINFDNSTNLKDTYLLGAAAGVDFNDYLGLRGFYYRSTEDKKISLDFDKMAMYGADFIAKLNVSSGIVPYLTVGGGYMNVYGSYVGVNENPFVLTSSGYFAKAGLGLSVPISSYLEVFGAANLLYTTDKDPEDLESTEDLKKHTMFNVGLKFNIGKSVRARNAVDSYVGQRVSNKTMMYEQRIAELNKELDKAYAVNDSRKATQILSEKQRLETELVATMDERGAIPSTLMTPSTYVAANDSAVAITTTTRVEDQTMIRLTPQELESLVDKVVQGVGAPVLKKETPEERLDRLERLILGGGSARVVQQPATFSQQPEVAQDEVAKAEAETSAAKAQEESVTKRIDDRNKELLNEIRRISERIEDNSKRIDNAYRPQQQSGSDRTVIVTPGGGGRNQTPFVTAPQMLPGNSQSGMYQGSSQGQASSWVIYKGLSPFLGMNIGDRSSFIFGIKGNYGFSSSRFVFVPDLYFGVGGKVAYGINANVTYPLIANIQSLFTPYVGVGLGLNKADKFKFGINFIGGTYVNVGNGSLFVEYTSRQFFDNNLFSLGYRFAF